MFKNLELSASKTDVLITLFAAVAGLLGGLAVTSDTALAYLAGDAVNWSSSGAADDRAVAVMFVTVLLVGAMFALGSLSRSKA